MASALKVLGQSAPLAATATKLYAAPGQVAVSSLTVCNSSATPTKFRVSVRIAAAADDPKQYLYYDTAIPGNQTFTATLGVSLASTDEVWVYATLATLAFSLFGQEQ